MLLLGRKTGNHLPTFTKPHKQPLKNPTFQPESNNSEMFEKHFLIVVVLQG